MKKTSTNHVFAQWVRRLSLAIAFVTFAVCSYAQQRVTGTVLDAKGEPVIGASVVVEGTTNGTTTGIDGKFALNVPARAQLTVSFLGYKSRKIDVAGKTDLAVTLEEDVAMLDDVVVIGYGTVKKRDLTGAVASMKSGDITIAPTGNAMEALQGKVAGMDIVKNSGQIGDNPQIQLRGSRSIYGSNEPLFIIDGFPGSYDQVNPSDIESIDVLKDASSTAIYGSAGANGVVMITTKRGKAGKATVNLDMYYGVSGSPNYTHGMTGAEWVAYQSEAYAVQHGAAPDNISSLLGNQAYIEAYNEGKWIDWVEEAAGHTAVTQKYNISVTGGNDKTKVFASASYANDQGLLRNEERDQYQLRMNIDQEIFSWARAGFSSHLTYTDHDRGVQNTFTGALTAFPLGDARDENGNFRPIYIDGRNTPMGDFIPGQFKNNTISTYVNANAYLEIMPLKGLSLKTQFGARLSNSRRGEYWGLNASANPRSYAALPWAEKTHANAWKYIWENIVSYNRTFAENHTVGAQFITSWQKGQDESTIAGGSGQDVTWLDKWGYNQMLSTASGNRYIYSDFSQTQQMSFALRLNYSYKGKYLFSFSNRWDGVSWFAEGDKWDSFPSAAFAWRISDEKFMKGAENWLDNLKLRVSYGVTGNAGGMGAYATTTQTYSYTGSGITIDGEPVAFTQYTGTFGGSISWEKSHNWNVGLDFGLFKGRLDGTVEWFRTKTDGLLFKRTLPITSGLTGWGSPLSSWQNLAETSNRGIEVTLNARTIQKKNFKWNTALTVTWSREKIESLPDGDIVKENLFVGQPIHAIYGYKYLGIWGTDEAEEAAKYGCEPGFVKVQTIPNVDDEGVSDNGVHNYGDKDQMILGHSNPNWIIGLNNTFTYKNFDLTVYVMARTGQTIASDLIGRYTAKASVTSNQPAGVDYWTAGNQGAYYPRPGVGDRQSAGFGSFNIVDGSFIKIKNITLGYTLPQAISRKLRMERLRLYATCYNPFIYAFDKNLRKLDADPETNGSDAFPTYKQFVFGLNITF